MMASTVIDIVSEWVPNILTIGAHGITKAFGINQSCI
jgi:hypothetical protein